MAYADYDYYTQNYLMGKGPAIPEEEFLFFEKQASREIDLRTFNRIRANPTLLSEEVKECACAIAEFLYEADSVVKGAVAQGLAGPLASWSNDGESGSVDVSQSNYTESGKKAKIRDLIYLYLANTGLLYAGV